MNSKIKILVLAVNPVNTSQLRLDEEVRSIQEELERAKYRDRFELISQWAVRVRDLSRALLDHKPHIVHFSGHGTGSQDDSTTRKLSPFPEDAPEPEGLVLEDDQGRATLVSTDALAGLFKLLENDVKCVVLNACYSEMQAKAIHQHIDCVVGMNKAIGDRAAIEFARVFYQALARGDSFNFAYQLARNSLDLHSIPESLTPVLDNRRGSDDPFNIKTPPPDSDPPVTVPAPQPKPPVKQSQTFGNITFSGSNNPLNAIQSTGNVNVTQTNTQTTGGNTDLEAALDALAKLKKQVAATDGLSTFTKKDTESKIEMLEEELQKPKPDKSFINEVVDALKQGLQELLTLAEPVAKVEALIVKAWVG
ncbi:MAG: CHAT domain-containing protein [Xenococcaceae cyanobacterium MO_188.B29]|nr:CHAT domain-containing protein [Xenococcaceae cyanobacterium MO_188.B29]